MKHIGYWEFETKDIEAVIKKYYAFKKLMKASSAYSLSFPKPISTSYQVGEMNGFQLFDVENEEQIANLMAFYRPEMRWEFMPIIPAKDSITTYFTMSKTMSADDMWKEIEEKLEKRRKEIEKID
jgi:hypothetical protein